MRFIYHWNNVDAMSQSVYDTLDKVESMENDNLEVKQVWWVPTPLTASFRFSDSYNAARNQMLDNGTKMVEYPAIFEHGGQTFTGVFFVEYYIQEMAVAA